jgi:predicted dehydrogenase
MSLTIAVVGTGYWGRNHVRTLAALRNEGAVGNLVVCDLDEQRAREMAAEFDCVWHTNPATLVAEHSIDAATIATPTPQHAPLGSMLMQQGVDVLIEKPLAMNEAEARKLVETAKTTGRLLMVGHLFRHHAAIREARRIIESGTLGPILHIESERLSVREPRPDVGVIAALAIHDLDICCDVLGDLNPEQVTAVTFESSLTGIEDHATIHMQFAAGSGGNESGVSAHITVSWRSRVRGKVRALRIIGRDASLGIDYLDHAGLWLHEHPNNAHGPEWGGFDAAPRTRIELPLGEPSLTAELRCFTLACSGRWSGELLSPGEVGIKGMHLVDRALASANRNR